VTHFSTVKTDALLDRHRQTPQQLAALEHLKALGRGDFLSDPAVAQAIADGKLSTNMIDRLLKFDAKGTFDQNKLIGKLFEIQQFARVKAMYPNAVEQITILTPSGERFRIDAMASYVDADGKTQYVLFEFKSSATAGLTESQIAGFDEFREAGGTIVGKGKPGFSGDTYLSGSKVTVVHPGDPIPTPPT